MKDKGWKINVYFSVKCDANHVNPSSDLKLSISVFIVTATYTYMFFVTYNIQKSSFSMLTMDTMREIYKIVSKIHTYKCI